MRNRKKTTQSEILTDAPLRYAPANELGVAFLFADLAKRWRLRIDSIKSDFPDCIAYQKIQGAEKRVRIEFEFRSKNFRTHWHSTRRCDWIVCWENNWPDAPEGIEIVELRREYGLGFNVWFMPVNAPYKEVLDQVRADETWSVPSQAHKGDLILFYFTRPEKSVSHLFVLRDRVRKERAHWKRGKDYFAPIRRVCRLKAPVFFEDLQRDRVLKTAGFVRCQMQGRPNATEYWPYLYDLIIRRNPSVRRKLQRYAPQNT